MKKLLLLLLGLLLFAAFGYFCVHILSAPAIEADIKNKVKGALVRNNLPLIKVDADGRDITLTGTVSSDKLKVKATRVSAVEGHNVIYNRIKVIPEQVVASPIITEPYTMLLRLTDDKSLVLSGSVPSVEAKNKLLMLATSRYGRSNVSDDLSVKAKAPANWQETSITALNSFLRLTQGQISLSDQDFVLKGLTSSEVLKQQIGEYLEGNLPKNYHGELEIVVVSQKTPVDEALLEQPMTVKNCQKEFNELLDKNKILFQTGGNVIAKSSTKLLDKLVVVAMKCPQKVIVVAGYTDSQGSKRNNKELSQKRAQSVVNYLQEKGISKKNLKAIGYGEEQPVSTNRTAKGRALNRRIEFTVEGVE
jgi:OOP family OmpA-OmpF porin